MGGTQSRTRGALEGNRGRLRWRDVQLPRKGAGVFGSGKRASVFLFPVIIIRFVGVGQR